MNWKPVREEMLPALVRFLSEREWGCVTFSSRLIQEHGCALPPRREDRISICSSAETGTTCGAVLQTSHGFFYPVFHRDGGIHPNGPRSEQWRIELRKSLRLSTSRVHSIMGIRRDVEMLEVMIPRIPIHRIEYYLMVESRTGSFDSRKLPPGLRFRRASLADADYLFPIQREYEKEEVLLAEDRFDAENCRYHLQQNLADQIIYIAELNGQAVAKAGTNARGFHYDQIGGVYTRPDVRNRSIGAALMTRLMHAISTEGKKCCLFVKQHNAPAIAMYTRLGYVIQDEFRITYY